MSRFNAYEKCCGTCEYFHCRRTIDKYGKIETEDKGICMSRNSNSNGNAYSASGTGCSTVFSRYKKWHAAQHYLNEKEQERTVASGNSSSFERSMAAAGEIRKASAPTWNKILFYVALPLASVVFTILAIVFAVEYIEFPEDSLAKSMLVVCVVLAVAFWIASGLGLLLYTKRIRANKNKESDK